MKDCICGFNGVLKAGEVLHVDFDIQFANDHYVDPRKIASICANAVRSFYASLDPEKEKELFE